LIKKRFADMGVSFDAETAAYIEAESKFVKKIFDQSLPEQILIAIPSQAAITKAIGARPIANLGMMKTLLPRMSKQTIDRIDNVILQAKANGATTQQIAQRLRGTKAKNYQDGELELTRRQAMTVARTAVNHISSETMAEVVRENSDIVQQEQWISVLDGRTSSTCQALDLKIFDIGEGPRPPAHPNCRSMRVAYIKGLDDIEGTRTSEAITLKTKRNLAKLSTSERRAVRSQLSKSVSEKQSYGDWLKGRDPKFVEEVLGKGKADLFLSGKVKIDQFVDSNYRPLSLAEIKQKYDIK
jgi:SPP1 gp7 family putative phage head morphogenesis protein